MSDFPELRRRQDCVPFAIPYRNEESTVQTMLVQQCSRSHIRWVTIVDRTCKHGTHRFLLHCAGQQGPANSLFSSNPPNQAAVAFLCPPADNAKRHASTSPAAALSKVYWFASE